MNTYLNFNGKLIRSGKPVIHADNRSFRYGDGIFETIRVSDGKIILANFHFDRLFSAIQLLKFERPSSFTADCLSGQITELCRKNHHLESARVRLVVFRGDGGLYDLQNHFPNHIIQSYLLKGTPFEINENGWVIDLCQYGRKAQDIFSNLKSNNYLIYVMAALYAKDHQLNDCLVLNAQGRICDSTMANVFCVKNGIIYTPPLSEGCVAGVVRRYLVEKMRIGEYEIQEKELDIGFLQDADELFLTNAILGIRWVQRFGDKTFGNKAVNFISHTVFKNFS